MRGYQQTHAYQKAMRKRQVWVEPLFAEAKDWHGLRRFRLRRLWRVNCEALCDCRRAEPQAAPEPARLGTAPAAQRGGYPLGCSLLGACCLVRSCHPSKHTKLSSAVGSQQQFGKLSIIKSGRHFSTRWRDYEPHC